MSTPVMQIELPGWKKLRSGKVREIFDLGDVLLFVATDRMSAFDVIMGQPVPEKGRVLTQMSEFWFRKTLHIVPNCMLITDADVICGRLGRVAYREALKDRSMLMKKCRPLPVECIVRGYLAGSGWKEYKNSQTVCGIQLPKGLIESSKLDEPIFTPSTKAETGHDENITFDRAAEIIGRPLAQKVSDYSIAVYKFARDYAAHRGIIIADTKLEFGLFGDNDQLLLIDEVFTPDSSRFWPLDSYEPGRPQASFDKQFLRDYLEALCNQGGWNKEPPPPYLPDEIIAKTSAKYLEALQRLTA